MSTAWEKFQAATLSLAHAGPIKDRLCDAYQKHLAHVAEDELPKEMREVFRSINCVLTRERPMLPGEDPVKATIRKMSNDEAVQVACTVVRIFGAIPRSMSGIKGAPAAQIVPLYRAEG